MKRRLALGCMMAALIPTSLIAQVRSSSEVLLGPAVSVERSQPTPLPVTLDDEKAADTPVQPSVPATTRFDEVLQLTARAQSQEQPPAGSATTAPSYGTVVSPGNGSCATCTTTDPYTSGSNSGFLGGLRARVQSVIGTTGPVREWLRNYQPNVFHRGTLSIEFGSNYWRSPIYVSSNLDTRMVPLNTRFGIMLNEPCHFERLKGVFELIGEVDTIPIVWGGGSIIVGGSGILRYHIVRNHRIVPYVHIGFGGVWTDSASFANSPTTSNFNFMFQVASGSHLFLTKKWALFSETSYTMIHHLGIGEGPGYHVLGGLAGITRYFGGPDCRR